MSHGAHADAGSNKKVAIFIAVLAALLAVAETNGKSAQTAALFHNIDAANLWQFFQAKTIRRTTLQAAVATVELDAALDVAANLKDARQKQVAKWRDDIKRYDTEPQTQEGRQELMARAKKQEELRDRAMAAYHLFELSSAAFQIAIVLASASIITGAVWLVWLGGGLSVAGIALGAVAWIAPTAVHF